MAPMVNGERVDDEAIREEAERMRPEYEQAFRDEEPRVREARLQEWARENVIERTLLEQEAKADPEPIAAKELDSALEQIKEQHGGEESFYEQLGFASVDEVRQRLELRLRIDRVLERACGGLEPPSDEAVRRYYEGHREEFLAPEQVHVAHIVKHVGPEVGPEAARAELEKAKGELDGGADFAEVAAKYSDCPDNGGDLGYFAQGQMVEEFEHIVFSMAVGRTSEVFPSRFGFHIARLLDRKPPEPAGLDEVKDHIAEQLANEARNKALEAHLNELRMKATVTEA
jgi:parvulin-like peptidyl-prolyl isomerase